ncbi:MAG: hypothetical protein U0797_19735 [Gemmataceae bacterium]
MRSTYLAVCFVALPLLADDRPKPAAPGTLLITDAAGKEHKVTGWTFTAGTRRLGWLVPADKAKGKKAGPEALAVRDELKFNYLAGVVTLVPLDRLRSVRFEDEKMTVRAATGPKDEEDAVLVGTSAYKGINKVTLEADVDRGAAGVASLTFQGGVPRGIKALRFPEPKAEPFKPGRPAVVVTMDKDVERTHKVSDLQPLYLMADGREALSSTLMFKKTLKLDVAKVKSITAGEEEGDEPVWRVVQKDGDDSTLTLLTAPPLDGQKATLVGLLGRVPVGYKLIPIKRVKSVTFDSTEAGKPKVEF